MINDDLSKISAQAFKDFHKKKYQDASDGFRKCIELLSNSDSEQDLAEMKNNLSVALIEMHEPQQAYDVVSGTEEVFERLGDKKSQAMALANIGTALQTLGRKEEALVSFERSSDLFKETDEKLLRATILKKISDLQITTGKPLQAIASMQASYDQKESKTFKEKILGSALGKIFRICIK
jgi:tetratricopeptide (TPR) repeat protein